MTGNGLTKTSLIVVGNCLGDNYLRSLLYHPDFTTEFRKGRNESRPVCLQPGRLRHGAADTGGAAGGGMDVLYHAAF